MSSPAFMLPAALTLAVAFVHTIIGGRQIAAPLLAADRPHRVIILTHYYCWHIVTLVLFALGGAYAWAAFSRDAIEVALFATLLSAGFCLWGFALVAWKKQRHQDMPQWILFAVTTASAFWALS